jgi:general secretion pathway protein G
MSTERLTRIQRDRRARRGFSLIELLLVLVILAILSTVVVTKFTGRTEDAKKAAAKTDVTAMGVALDAFELDNGRFPSTEEGLDALIHAPAGVTNWKSPYLKKTDVPHDPWGRAYVYRYPGTINPNGYDLLSLGPDGTESPDDIIEGK